MSTKRRPGRAKTPHRDYQATYRTPPGPPDVARVLDRDGYLTRAEHQAVDGAYYAGLADHLAATLDVLPRERWADTLTRTLTDSDCQPECPICDRIGRPEERQLYWRPDLFMADFLADAMADAM